MTPVSRPIIALGILNVDAGRYSFDARAKLLVAQDLLLLLQSTKTPLTASAENSLFQNVFSVIELANAVLERHAVITYAANVFMAPSWWLTPKLSRGFAVAQRRQSRRLECLVRHDFHSAQPQCRNEIRLRWFLAFYKALWLVGLLRLYQLGRKSHKLHALRL